MLTSTHRDTPITPNELEMLHGLLRSICDKKSIDVQSQEGASTAADLIACFQRGVRDEKALMIAIEAM